MDNYLLSVIIPTKNRQYYCYNAVRQILSLYEKRVEIIIQDNSDELTLETQIRELGAENVVYNHVDGIVSFVDNFNEAISFATGKYLMIIGDDDGITSLALPTAEWADQQEICSIKPDLSFVYFWPGSEVFTKDDNGKLDITGYSGLIREYEPLEGVRVLLEKSCQNYLDIDLVKLYHGMVRRDLLETVREKTGRFVGGLSPDIYLSVALSLVSDKRAVSVGFPLTISGICTGSGSSQSATGEHTGRLEDAPHFKGHSKYEWDKRVPAFYSVETIWGDSALAAVKDIRPDYLVYYKPQTMTFRCLRKYPGFKDVIIQNYRTNGGKRGELLTYGLSRFLNRIKTKIVPVTNDLPTESTEHLETILDASVVCEHWIDAHRSLIEI